MPNRILIQPSAREYGSHRKQYETLAAELERKDVLVRIASPSEDRTAWASEPGEVYDLVIHVGEVAGAILDASELIALVRERLHDPTDVGKRRATLYLADGEKRVFGLGDGE
jgi:hypothetical protein